MTQIAVNISQICSSGISCVTYDSYCRRSKFIEDDILVLHVTANTNI